jgi:hypothetical protein
VVAKHKKPVVTVTASTATSGPTATATATCPRRRKAVGGGWSIPFNDNDQLVVYRSVREGARGWSTTAFRQIGTPTMVTYAYCRRVKKPIVDIATTATAGADSIAGADATCPGRKQKLISGGFSSDVGATNDAVMVPYVSGPNGKIWAYRAFNNGNSARTLTVHAYCTKGVKSADAVHATTTRSNVVPGDRVEALSPICASKRRVSAGGFVVTPRHTPGGLTPVVTQNRTEGASWLARFVVAGANGSSFAMIESYRICTK